MNGKLVVVILTAVAICYADDNDACTKDAAYKRIWRALTTAKVAVRDTVKAHSNDPNPGPYLTQVLKSGNILDRIDQFADGHHLNNKSDCLHIVGDFQRGFDDSMRRRNDTISGSPPYHGEDLYQSIIQNFGQARHDLMEITGNHTAPPTTKYESAVRRMAETIHALRAIIANNDNGPNCVAQLERLIGDFKNQMPSLQDQSATCSAAELVTGY